MLRTMFFIGNSQNFHDLKSDEIKGVLDIFIETLGKFQETFGAKIIASFDDDQMMVGPSEGWPWTAYIIADVPDLDSVFKICGLFRDTAVGDSRLWKYGRIQARVGRTLMGLDN
ncbi:hypothetical protein [Sphingomonas sp. SRS2]|uniref:hypothetical protein n=1 Tax=Sphingomonas sp. SRS2 TaxID=133190 RepID=UPI0006184A8D|nr:hypothetical protein [Sphingomonas sp. SRS2]KKC27654.1 hypothetical protein WP12_01945 [Sphingomonas sp. SRS2]